MFVETKLLIKKNVTTNCNQSNVGEAVIIRQRMLRFHHADEAQGGVLIPSGCCSLRECGRPPIACRRR